MDRLYISITKVEDEGWPGLWTHNPINSVPLTIQHGVTQANEKVSNFQQWLSHVYATYGNGLHAQISSNNYSTNANLIKI